MLFCIRYNVAGGHVHMRVFVASKPNTTFVKMGNLCCNRGIQFLEFRDGFKIAEFLPDTISDLDNAREAD